jgi:hypothetical protein
MKHGIAALGLSSKMGMIEYLTSAFIRLWRIHYSLIDIRHSDPELHCRKIKAIRIDPIPSYLVPER